MSRNAFNQIAADLEEDEEKKFHARMERIADLQSPIQSAVEQLSTKMNADIDAEILAGVRHVLGEDLTIEQIKERVLSGDLQMHRNVHPDHTETYVVNGTPIIRLHPMEIIPEGSKLTAHRNLEKLYVRKENT